MQWIKLSKPGGSATSVTYLEVYYTASAPVFSGSFYGTSSWSTYAVTSSYALLALTASYFSGSISNAISSSYSLTASYINLGGSDKQIIYNNNGYLSSSANFIFDYSTNSVILSGAKLNNTSSITSAGTTSISSISTGSYTSAFYNYTLISSSNARAGQVIAVWLNNTIQYSEVSTLDIGNTSKVSLIPTISGSFINLNVSSSGNWTVKVYVNLM
jgi:hypothetical protein